MRVAVTGATGLVGRFVIRKLISSGHMVNGLARVPDRVQGFDDCEREVKWFFGDFGDPDTLHPFLTNCDALVHSAFSHETGRFRGGEGNDPAGFWHSNVVGTIHCIERARAVGVRRIVLLSSRAVFDGLHQSSEMIADDAHPMPTTHYGLVKYVSEQMSRLHNDIEICSLRPTGIYGLTWPREHTKWWDLISNLHVDGRTDAPISQKNKTEIHGNDVASAILILLNAKDGILHTRSFNCSDVVVNEERVLQIAKCLLESTPYPSQDESLCSGSVSNQMSTHGLDCLGWTPGGWPLLIRTVQQILDASRKHL